MCKLLQSQQECKFHDKFTLDLIGSDNLHGRCLLVYVLMAIMLLTVLLLTVLANDVLQHCHNVLFSM